MSAWNEHELDAFAPAPMVQVAPAEVVAPQAPAINPLRELMAAERMLMQAERQAPVLRRKRIGGNPDRAADKRRKQAKQKARRLARG